MAGRDGARVCPPAGGTVQLVMGNHPVKPQLPSAPPPVTLGLVFTLLPLSPYYIANNSNSFFPLQN